mmetsp:Transcript_3253/g.9716  ORF Transcript_3253/g.9716 Transcript_3253/m.9716 type:complete len:435 (+) Transcript_3253:903-2207(+)
MLGRRLPIALERLLRCCCKLPLQLALPLQLQLALEPALALALALALELLGALALELAVALELPGALALELAGPVPLELALTLQRELEAALALQLDLLLPLVQGALQPLRLLTLRLQPQLAQAERALALEDLLALGVAGPLQLLQRALLVLEQALPLQLLLADLRLALPGGLQALLALQRELAGALLEGALLEHRTLPVMLNSHLPLPQSTFALPDALVLERLRALQLLEFALTHLQLALLLLVVFEAPVPPSRPLRGFTPALGSRLQLLLQLDPRVLSSLLCSGSAQGMAVTTSTNHHGLRGQSLLQVLSVLSSGCRLHSLLCIVFSVLSSSCGHASLDTMKPLHLARLPLSHCTEAAELPLQPHVLCMRASCPNKSSRLGWRRRQYGLRRKERRLHNGVLSCWLSGRRSGFRSSCWLRGWRADRCWHWPGCRP